MSLLNFKLEGDARQVNTLRQVIKAKLPVLVLQDVIVAVNTTQYDNQYIEDRMGNIPIHTLTTSKKFIKTYKILKKKVFFLIVNLNIPKKKISKILY